MIRAMFTARSPDIFLYPSLGPGFHSRSRSRRLANGSNCGRATEKKPAKSDKSGEACGANEPDMCLVPPGAQPMLPAKLLPGMGDTDMPVTTKSDEARKFFNQGVSQLHNFWVIEAERSFLQAATLDPDMAMAYWGIAISAAGDHRPAFQLRRDTNDGGRARGRGRDRSRKRSRAR